MRKYAEKCLEILHGFLLLSVFYFLLLQIVRQQGEISFAKSLILLPVSAVFSITVSKVRRFWQFLLIALLMGAAAVFAAGEGAEQIVMGICVALAAFSYFIARAKDSNCWLDQPAYPWLVVYVLLYLLANYFEKEFLLRYTMIGAGIYFLVYNFHTNLVEMDIFVQNHADLERFPVKRLARINQAMMWMVSGITVAAMCLSPYLGIDELIRQAGRLIKAFVGWLLRMLPSVSNQEMAEQTTQTAGKMVIEGVVEEPSALLALIYKIMDIIGWLMAIALVVLFLWLVLKKIYLLYRSFNAHTEENGDKIERLTADPFAVRKKDLERKKKETLFWDRSPDARIRKHYKRKIQQDLKEAPLPFWTPSRMEEEVRLEEDEKKQFHEYYEKARYGRESCSKEEMQKMLNIR